jgi:hypothetical protein
MYIDPAKVKQDIETFGPAISALVKLVPGETGNTLSRLLDIFSTPEWVDAGAAAVNTITGATPPTS